VTFDSEFVLPVLLPFGPGVLLEQDHLGEVGDRLVAPTPGDSLYAATDLSEHSFQQRGGFGRDDPRLQPHLNVGEQLIRETLR